MWLGVQYARVLFMDLGVGCCVVGDTIDLGLCAPYSVPCLSITILKRRTPYLSRTLASFTLLFSLVRFKRCDAAWMEEKACLQTLLKSLLDIVDIVTYLELHSLST
jgi:hypothetical protein